MGVILYALICGFLPFEDPSTPALYSKILSGKFTIPSFVSADASSLLRGILTVDPHKRFTIEDIRRNHWYNKYYQDPESSEGLYQGNNKVINEDVIVQLESLGFDRQYALTSLNKGKHNSVTATYHLLLDKKLKNPSKVSSVVAPVTSSLETPVRHKERRRRSVRSGSVASRTPVLDVIPEDDTVASIADADSDQLKESEHEESAYIESYRKSNVREATSKQKKDRQYTPDKAARRHSLAPHVDVNRDATVHNGNFATTLPIPPIQESFSRHQRSTSDQNSPEFRNRRASIAVDSTYLVSSPGPQPSLPTEGSHLRVHKGAFNVNSTSSKDPSTIITIIKQVASDLAILFEVVGNYKLDCVKGHVKFEVEVKQLFGFDALYVVTFSRISGDTWRFKGLCQEFLGKLSL
ncbi:hypothetical protein P9112_002184 [Eukaryota sp. TZLM1-RC]